MSNHPLLCFAFPLRACTAVLPLLLVLCNACLDPMVREVFLDNEAAAYVPYGNRPSEPGAVGDLCIPTDDDFTMFGGFSVGEVNIATGDSQCRSQVCLVNHFQGRAGCPEGNLDGGECLTPLGEVVTVPVEPQLPERPPEDTIYCSCRCDAPPGIGPLCDCPRGMVCEELLPGGSSFSESEREVVGSYCVKPLQREDSSSNIPPAPSGG